MVVLNCEMKDKCFLHVIKCGVGIENLIFIHGFGENSYAWHTFSEQMLSVFTIYCIDLRGHGDSDWDPNSQYRLERFVTDIITVIDRLSLNSFSVVGHSLGAEIALCVALRRHGMIRKLGLVEYGIDGPSGDVLAFTVHQFMLQFKIYDSQDDYYTFLQTQRPLADRRALRRFAIQSVKPEANRGYVVKCDPNLRALFDVEDKWQNQRQYLALSTLVCPILFVRGAGSAVVAQSEINRMMRMAPKARLAVIKGAGHAVMLDRPQEFNDALSQFLISPQSDICYK